MDGRDITQSCLACYAVRSPLVHYLQNFRSDIGSVSGVLCVCRVRVPHKPMRVFCRCHSMMARLTTLFLCRVFNTPTGLAFLESAPHTLLSLSKYGDEVYGSLRTSLPTTSPQPKIPFGGLAYSEQGQYLCIFYGQTPAWPVEYFAQIEMGYEMLGNGMDKPTYHAGRPASDGIVLSTYSIDNITSTDLQAKLHPSHRNLYQVSDRCYAHCAALPIATLSQADCERRRLRSRAARSAAVRQESSGRVLSRSRSAARRRGVMRSA